MGELKLKMVADWQEVDTVFDDSDNTEDATFGIWFDNMFIALDNFIRYGTMWIGDAPKCVDESGEDVTIHAVSTDLYYPYYAEIDDASQQIRLWRLAEGSEW